MIVPGERNFKIVFIICTKKFHVSEIFTLKRIKFFKQAYGFNHYRFYGINKQVKSTAICGLFR